MWMQSENIVHRLFSRQLSSGRPNTNIHRARGLYENVVPSHTVYEVDCPDQWWRRFTNDGQYLICFCKTYQDLLIYRPLWPSYSSALDRPDLPNKFHKFESYFQLLHQVPLARAVNEVICKDFFLQTDNNLYGIFATSTAPDPNGAAIHGAVPGVPCIEKITFLVVRFADGVVTGRSVFKDDYIHLAHNAGAFLHEDLLSVLSIRFQRIHILQVREGGLFLDVRTIGDFCREDDELLLNSQAQAESQFQEEQRLQRKARGRAQEDEALASPSKARMLKPWTIIDRKRPRYRDSRALRDDLGTHAPYLTSEGGNGDEIDVLYDGYFRGLFTPGRGAPVALPNGTSNRSHGEHAQVRRFRVGAAVDSLASLSNGTNTHVVRHGDQETGSHATLHGRQRFEHYNYEISSGRRFAIPVGHDGLPPQRQPSSSAAGRDSFETSNSGRRYGGTTGLSSSGSLYSSGGSDSASYSNNSSDATALHEYSSHHVMRHEAGPSERWARRPPIVAPPSRNRDRDRSEFRDELMSLGEGPSRGSAEVGDIQQTTLSTGGSGGRSGRLGTNLGDSGVPYVPVHVGGHGSVWGGGGGGAQPGNAAAAAAAAAATTSANGSDGAPNGGQMLRGLKQRLLSFILQGIKNDDTTPANRAQRLKRFYYHFHQYVDLVMWKVQFLDRYHLLIKFGSADGVVLRNSEASSQNAFLAVYNTETTEILGFYQNSSEELLQLVERYWDHFRVAPQYPSYMSFISSYANNSFAREQFRKEKDACLAGKIGSYTQVIKRTLASLPYNSQSQSPSAYFDQYLFHYDEKLISSTDRHKPCAEHPIKFISRRRPNTLKFKINPGLEHGSNDGHVKRVASFLFHPIFPFAISVQQSFMQTSIVNFHFRR